MTELVKDTTWIRRSFFSPPENTNDLKRFSRSEGGWLKFMDTTLGGNTAINAPYQFTRYADIKERRLLPDVGKGMGAYYSQYIDDWGHNVHFRMGIPSFAGIVPFAMKAINGPAARYVATGRVPGYFSALGRIGGYIVSAAFWEITLLSMFISTIIDLTHSRFYYLKPTMFQYWKTVQTILNVLSANLGISIPTERAGGESLTQLDANILGDAKAALPDTFRTPVIPGGTPDIGVDAHAVASRAQALQIRHQQEMIALLEGFNHQYTANDLIRAVEERMRSGSLNNGNKGSLKPSMTNATLDAYMNSFTFGPYSEEVDEEVEGKDMKESISKVATQAGDAASSSESGLSKWFKSTTDSFTKLVDNGSPDKAALADKLLAELRDGSQWCSFRVDNAVDSVGESFSNSSEKSDIANIFNNLSQIGRSARFNLAGGTTGITMLDAGIEAATGAIGDALIDGLSTAVNFVSPVIGLLYGAQIEIPKRWGSSSTSMPTTTFELELKAGYGNVISYYQDILFPLSMLLAMALPRGTGPQSYGSPFYVQYYSKGRSQVKIGLVSSLSITRGTGAAPWHKRGWPMGVRVSMTVEDMSEVMFTPIAQGLKVEGLGAAGAGLLSPIDENAMGDYLAVLSALGMNEQEYFLPRLKRRFSNLINDFNGWMSPQRWMALGVDTAVGDLLKSASNATTIRN